MTWFCAILLMNDAIWRIFQVKLQFENNSTNWLDFALCSYWMMQFNKIFKKSTPFILVLFIQIKIAEKSYKSTKRFKGEVFIFQHLKQPQSIPLNASFCCRLWLFLHSLLVTFPNQIMALQMTWNWRVYHLALFNIAISMRN